MTNRDYYGEKILDIIEKGYVGIGISKKDKKPMSCTSKCEGCLFEEKDCGEALSKWMKAECNPFKNMPVDTPIMVSDDNKYWIRRYFVKYEDGKVWCWDNGATSWNVKHEECITPWDYWRLLEEGSADK